MNYGGAYRNTPRRLAFQARAEDLDLVENLIVNKEGRIPDIGYPCRPRSGLHRHDRHRARPGVSHQRLGPRRPARPPRSRPAARLRRLRGHRGGQPRPTNAEVADLAHAQGALVGYVHPFDSDPDPADTTQPLTAEFPVDLALGKVDYYEALGFVDDPMATAHVWYRPLNCGFRLPAGAGTDAMANFASLRGPVGMNRVYVRTGGALDQRRLLRLAQGRPHLRHQRPLLELTLGGRGLGDELRLPPGARGWSRGCRSGRTCRSTISRSWATARSCGTSRSPATGPAWTTQCQPAGAAGAAGSCSGPGATGRSSIRCSISIPMRRPARST